MRSASTNTPPQHEIIDAPRFPGAPNCQFTEKMEFTDPSKVEPMPVYRVMDRQGKVIDESHDPQVKLALCRDQRRFGWENSKISAL